MRIKFFTILCLAVLAYISFSSKAGGAGNAANQEVAGTPGSGSCTNCHSQPPPGGVPITTLTIKNSAGVDVTQVMPDSVYDVAFQITNMGGPVGGLGFQAIFLSDSANANAGTFTTLGAGQHTKTFANGRVAVEHSTPLFGNNTFSFKWRAPLYIPGGTARLYARGLIANMDGSSLGDLVTGVNTISVSMATPSSTSQIDLNNFEMSVYPNPVVEDLNMTFNVTDAEQFNLTVYNSKGQKLSTEIVNAVSGSNNHSTNVAALSAGIYRLVLENDKGQRAVKSFVKF